LNGNPVGHDIDAACPPVDDLDVRYNGVAVSVVPGRHRNRHCRGKERIANADQMPLTLVSHR
jgi:hypothetical protein